MTPNGLQHAVPILRTLSSVDFPISIRQLKAWAGQEGGGTVPIQLSSSFLPGYDGDLEFNGCITYLQYLAGSTYC